MENAAIKGHPVSRIKRRHSKSRCQLAMNIALGNKKNNSLPTGLIHLAKDTPSLAGRSTILRGVTTRSQKNKSNHTPVKRNTKRKRSKSSKKRPQKKKKKRAKSKKRKRKSKKKRKKKKKKGKRAKAKRGKRAKTKKKRSKGGRSKKNKLLFQRGRAIYYNALGKKKTLTFAQVTKKVPRQTLLKLLGQR